MKRDFSIVVKDYDGRPRFRPIAKYDKTGLPAMLENGQPAFSHYEPMTLRTYALDALAGRWQGEELSLVDAAKRVAIHDKLAFSPDGAVELTAEEGTIIMGALEKQKRDFIVLIRMKQLIDSDPT